MKAYFYRMRYVCTLLLLALIACNNNTIDEKINQSKVIDALQAQLKQHPDSTGLLLQLAMTFDSIGAPAKALPLMQQMIAKDSSNFGLWYAKGKIEEHAGDTAKALASYTKAARIYPSADALLSIANLYAEQKNNRALLAVNEVAKMKLGREYDAHCHFIAGVFYARTKDTKQAIEQFDACVANNYTYMEAYIEKGLVFFDQQQYKEALAVFSFAATINNRYADAYYYMARCYEMMQQKDSALLRFEQALQLDPTLKEANAAIERLR